MAYTPPTRSYSKRQHSDGCSINPISLDATMEDFIARHNALGRGDVATRYTKQTYVLGWEPPLEDPFALAVDRLATKLPFMSVNNSAATMALNGGSYDDSGENDWRHKGHNVTVIDPTNRVVPGDQETNQFAWTTAMMFPDPVIVDELCLVLEADAANRDYNNTFVYPNPAGGGRVSPATQITLAAPDAVSDIVLQMQIDSDLGRNNCELSDLVVNVWDFRADGRQFRNLGVATDSMSPVSVNGAVDGLLLKFSNLNVPLPEFARARFSLILPWYDADVYDADNAWNDPANLSALEVPWGMQAYSLSITVLEMLRR